jgi:hypothetical protein
MIDRQHVPTLPHRSGPRRRWSLRERMNGQYWRIARRRHALRFVCGIFREGKTISPFQYEMAVTDLTRLRRAVEHAHHFYSTLDEDGMKRVQPSCVITKLADFEAQVTEVLLYIVAMQETADQAQVFIRVQLHLVIRHLFPVLLNSFEDLASQLEALPGKVEAAR